MSTPESYIEAGRKRLDGFFIKVVPHIQLFNPQTAICQAGLGDRMTDSYINTEQLKAFIVDIYYNIDSILQNEARAKWLHQFLQLTEYSIRPALHTHNTDHQQLFTQVIMKLKIAYYKFEAEYLLTQGMEHKEKAENLKLTARFLQLQLDKKTGHMHTAATSSIDRVDPASDTKKTDDPEVIITASAAAALPSTPVADEQGVPVIISEKKSFLAAARAAIPKEKIKSGVSTEVAAVEFKQEQKTQAAPAPLPTQRREKRTVASIPVPQEQQEEAKKVAEKIKLEEEKRAAARLEQEKIQREKLAAEKQQQLLAERERQQLLQVQQQAAEEQRKQQRKKEAEKRQADLAARRAKRQRTRQELAAANPDKIEQGERASANASIIITASADLQALLVKPRLKDSLGEEGSVKYNCFTTIMNSCYSIAGMIKTSLAHAEVLHQEITTPSLDDDFAVGLFKVKPKIKAAKEKKTVQIVDELEKYLQAMNYLFQYFNAELETIVSLDDYAQSILKSYILHVTAEFNMFMYYPKVEHAITLSKYRPLFDSIGKLAAAIMVKALTRKEGAVLTLLLNGFLCVYITVKQKQKISYSLKELSKQVEQLLKEFNPQVAPSQDLKLSGQLSRRERFSQFGAEEKASALCNFIYFYSGNEHVFLECRAIILALCQALDVTEIANMAIWFKSLRDIFPAACGVKWTDEQIYT